MSVVRVPGGSAFCVDDARVTVAMYMEYKDAGEPELPDLAPEVAERFGVPPEKRGPRTLDKEFPPSLPG